MCINITIIVDIIINTDAINKSKAGQQMKLWLLLLKSKSVSTKRHEVLNILINLLLN